MTRLALLAAAATLTALAAPAAAAPLLLIEGGDTSVVVLDLGARDVTGDIRAARIYRGQIASGGQPRSVTGEKRAFDCPGRRQQLVARLAPSPTGPTQEIRAESAWEPIGWKSPMDYAATAVCLGLYDKDLISAKTDVPAILRSLEQVWQPGAYQPPVQPVDPPRRRSWRRPF